jgi:hypothetical protein
MMTKQEIFDKVSKHLITQNRKAMDRNECQYLAPDSTRCAVGCLIPERLYSSRIEGCIVSCLVTKTSQNREAPYTILSNILTEIGIEEVNYPFLASLQNIHDYAAPQEWKHKLTNFAEEHSLNINF